MAKRTIAATAAKARTRVPFAPTSRAPASRPRQARLRPTLVLILFLLGVGVARSEEPLALNEFLSANEYRDYQRKTRYKDRMDLFRKILERRSDELTMQIKTGNVEEGLKTLLEIRSVCAVARQQADHPDSPKDYRSKQSKKLEIELRKLVEALDDLKNSVSFEQRDQFEITADILEQLRDNLLAHYFGKAISSDASALAPPRHPPRGPNWWARGNALVAPLAARSIARRLLPASPAVQRRPRSTISGDQFTDAEYEKIQDAQELLKRVKLLLEIAASRLDEIERRSSGREWDKKEPNPLEFFTYGQLMHAYARALETLMINIDEKAKFKTASEKDIRKSLEQVNEKVAQFQPRLAPIKRLAEDRRDEELYLELRAAKKESDIALKGSQLGLGAPVQ